MKFIFLYLLSMVAAAAATLNVPGSYATVAAAVAAAQPGDTVLLAPGIYNESVDTVRDGTALAPITINGQGGLATVRRMVVKHDYHVFEGVRFSGTTTLYSSQMYFSRTASFNTVRNCIINAAYAFKVYGVAFEGASGTDASDNTFDGTVFENVWAYPALSMSGSRNVVKNCHFRDCVQIDFIRLFGVNNLIQDSIFERNLANPEGWVDAQNHPDFIQTFGNNGGESYGHIIERNIIRDMPGGQGSQLSATGQPDIRDWTFRNNIFSDIGLGFSCTMAGVKYFNNTFYRCNYVNKGHVLSFGSRAFGGAEVDSLHPLHDIMQAPTPSGSIVAEGDGGVFQFGAWYEVTTPQVPEYEALTVGRTYRARTRNTARVVYNGTEINNNGTFTVLPGITSWSKTATVAGDLSTVQLYLDALITYNGTGYGRQALFQGVTGVATFTANYPDAVFAIRMVNSFAERCEAKNNVFLDCGDPALLSNGWYAFNADYDGIAADGNYVAKNGFSAVLLKTNTIPIGETGWGGKGWYEPNGITGGLPGFVDQTNGDFRLQPGSLLIDRGVTVGSVVSDYALATRPQGAGHDIGAHEYAGAGQIVTEYHVAPGGDDDNDGSEAAPFATIQQGVDVSPAGKTLFVSAGTYPERVTTARGGTSGSRVRIVAEGEVVMKGFIINHPFVTVDGFTVTGHSAASVLDAHIKIAAAADSTEVKNCTVEGNRHMVRTNFVFASGTNVISSATGGFTSVLGVQVGDTIFVERAGTGVTLSGLNGSAHTVTAVTSDTSITVSTALTAQGPVQAYITASYQYGLTTESGTTDALVQGCTFEDLSFDAMYIVGDRNTVERNIFRRGGGWDIIHFGGNSLAVRDNTFVDSPFIVYSPSADVWENLSAVPYSNAVFERNFVSSFAGVIAVQKGATNSTGLQIKNNIFVDVGHISLTHPNSSITGNTFLRVSRTASDVVGIQAHPIYVNETAGATGVTVTNNAFIDCGQSGTGAQNAVGWYEVLGRQTFAASKNFASGVSPVFAAKTSWPETTLALNGGDPGFVALSLPLGGDGLAFTADDGLRLAAGSKLLGAGVGGVDIGAYGVVSALPPATPTGLTSIALGTSGIGIAWTDASTNETSFELAMSLDGVAWLPSSSLAADLQETIISGLAPGVTYYFRLRSVNAYGPSAWSATTATTTGTVAPARRGSPNPSSASRMQP